MSLDRSLKGANALVRHRNVLTRTERLEKLAEEEKWNEAKSVFGLPKVAHRKQSVGGVSMDEEMSNMVKFQRGYQASARAMSTMDEMLDTLINRTGKVGL